MSNTEWSPAFEMGIRAFCFVTLFVILGIWEKLHPKRPWRAPKKTRWFNNLGIVTLNSLLIRLIFPLMAIDMAFLSAKNEWGLFNQGWLPESFALFLGVIALDFTIYFQHRLFHAVPLFWKFHRMHHADLDVDVTTGTRFHPIEIALSMIIKIGAVVVFGVSAMGVLLFEILLNATSMFSHSNLSISQTTDRILRSVIVTPDMHRVHHSMIPSETNSNFGFNLSIWDKIFKTYLAQPREGHQKMSIGLDRFREMKFLTLPWMLLIPFLKKEKTPNDKNRTC